MASYRVFTISDGSVLDGAVINSLTLKGKVVGTEIPAIIIGEEGRGRSRGVVTVQNAKSGDVLRFAEIGKTRADKPKFYAKFSADTEDEVLVVFRTPIGYRGGNSHTGDRIGWVCDCGEKGEGNMPDKCPNAKCTSWIGPGTQFAEFPGEILATGEIAQGDAGRMGSGYQHIALVRKGQVFRTGYSGRRYGSPHAHYYIWNGEQLLSATWDERAETDIF